MLTTTSDNRRILHSTYDILKRLGYLTTASMIDRILKKDSEERASKDTLKKM